MICFITENPTKRITPPPVPPLTERTVLRTSRILSRWFSHMCRVSMRDRWLRAVRVASHHHVWSDTDGGLTDHTTQQHRRRRRKHTEAPLFSIQPKTRHSRMTDFGVEHERTTM